ncbi:Acetyltransferase [Granulibacter bethesdensis]|uniref:Acetyltransferase n=2 Tax=Granulibacter bethesdensis TaxID=364410 RepID=A0AAC9KFW2_9PROT|nr:Acetyltransferase [Granulibacter bethesdensis]APH63117.1 Acetyltransferase [Granulibacter bethesdensis]
MKNEDAMTESTQRLIVPVTDLPAEQAAAWLDAAQAVHRQLRPAIPDPYATHMRAMIAQGAEIAVLAEGGLVRAVAVYRCYLTTYRGFRFYVDDLVTDEASRSCGHGETLLGWLRQRAKERGCQALDLDSGVQRTRAHRFYFREGMWIAAYSFTQTLAETG